MKRLRRLWQRKGSVTTGRTSTPVEGSMATLPVEKMVVPDEEQRGLSKNEVGGGGDTGDVCNVDGCASSITEGNVHETANYRSGTSGGGLPCQAADSGDTSRSHGETESAASETAKLVYYSSPSLSTRSTSALDAAGASESVRNWDEYDDTGVDAAGVAAEVALGGGGSGTVDAGGNDAGNANLGRSVDGGNTANVGSTICEAERGAAKSCMMKDGRTAVGDVGISARHPAANIAEGYGTGGGSTKTAATGSVRGGSTTGVAAASGSVGFGNVACAAAASYVPRGRGRIVNTGPAYIPPRVPSSVRCGVYVINIPMDAEEDELRALFEPYGEVLRLRLVRCPEYTTCLIAYVLLDSEDNTKRAIRELDGKVLKGHPLKVQPTFGRMAHIFGIDGGTPYNRSRAAFEQWRQNRDAQQASGTQKRQQRNDDQWRRGYNDRNYHQGDLKFGNWCNGYRRRDDRFDNNDRRYGGRGGDDRYGAHNCRDKQGRYNNRYDDNRNCPRQQHSGYHGDGGGHRQHLRGSPEAPNQRGGMRPSDDAQRRQRGRGDNRHGGDFFRRGGGGHDGGNRSGEDEGHANYELTQEARRRMRDRLATGAGGEDFGQEDAPNTVSELLRWRHGEDSVAGVFRDVADEAATKDEGGVCLITVGGADGEQGPRSLAREDVLSAATKDRDGGPRDVVEAVFNEGASREGDAALTSKQNEDCLKEGQPSAEERVVEQQPICDSESTVAGSNTEKSVTYKDENIEPLAAPTSKGRNCSTSEDDDTSKNASLGLPATSLLDALDLAGWESSEGWSEDDTLHIERAPRRCISIMCLIEKLDNAARRQVQVEAQQRSSEAEDEQKDTVSVEQPSKQEAEVAPVTDCTGDRAGKIRGSSIHTELATAAEDARDKVTSGAYSAGANATDGAIQEAGHSAAALQDVEPGKSERNVSVADELQCSVDTKTNETDGGEPNGAQPQRKVALAMTHATIAERMQASSTWNRKGVVASVQGVDEDSGEDGTDDYEDATNEDESDYSSDEESFITQIMVRVKNARNAVHLAASRETHAPRSARAAEECDVPRERWVGKAIFRDLTEDENVPPRPPAPLPPYEPFVFGRLSSSSGVSEDLAQSDLLHRDSGGLTSGSNKLAAAPIFADYSNDRMHFVVLDETEAACVEAKELGESGAKPEETRHLQRAKRRLRQTVADGFTRRFPPGDAHPSKSAARVDAVGECGTSESAASARERCENLKRNEVEEGIQSTSACCEDDTRRAFSLPRKRVLEENSDTDDEPSDSEVDDSLRRETSPAKHRDCKAADSIDPPAEVAEGCEDERVCGVTPKKGRRPTEEHLFEGDGVSGTRSSATVQDSRGDVNVSTGRDERSANDGVALHYDQEEDGRRDGAEEDTEVERPAMTCEGIEKCAQDGGGAQHTADEQGAAQSSCAGGGDDSDETGRRDDAVDTRLPPRALRRGEEIECEPSDDDDGQ